MCIRDRHYAKDMVTGFIRLNGMTVGAVANRSKVYNEEAEVVEEFDGSLSAKGAEKAADFITFCDAFNIPVLTPVSYTHLLANYEELEAEGYGDLGTQALMKYYEESQA